MRQATFSIRKVIQNGYTFYSIYTPAYLSPTGKKHYQYFGTKAEAERKRAELIASTRTESKITDLSNVQIRDAQRALERLAEHGLEFTLDRAIELALPVLRSSGRKITVDQLFQNFATAKQNDWSDASKQAFNTSAKTFLRRWSGTLISTIDGDDLETWYNSTFPSSGSPSQPIQWSSEVRDGELGLVYYNYRHYNPTDNRWIRRDSVTAINLYVYLNGKIDYVDYLGNEIFNPQTLDISQHHSEKQIFPEIPERTDNIARSYTYIFGNKLKKSISSYLGSLKADRIQVVTTIYDLLDDVKNSLKKQECISNLLVLGHGYDGHVIRNDNYQPIFSDVEHISKSGDVLAHAMCKTGKIVFASCYAATSMEMLIAFSKHVGVKVMANPSEVTMLNDSIMKNRLTGEWRKPFAAPLNNVLYSIYTGIFYAYKAEWKVFHPDGTQTPYQPIETNVEPIIHKNNRTYIGLSTLFGF